VHLNEASDPFSFSLDGIENGIPRLERPGIDPEEGQLSCVGIIHDFESQCGERVPIVGGEGEFLALEVNPFHGRDI
jgi:hypothetical protein